MKLAEFFIPIEPVAKGRPKFSTRGGCFRTYTPSKTASFERTVRDFLRDYMQSNHVSMVFDACALEVVFWMKRPKCRKVEVWSAVRPDLDNVVKGLTDAMNGVLLKDDSLICKLDAKKMYQEDKGIGIYCSLTKLPSP
jgi:Holliday junction resolvase RusA-like endonuclease